MPELLEKGCIAGGSREQVMEGEPFKSSLFSLESSETCSL